MSAEITGTRVDRLRSITTSYRDARESFEHHRDRWHEAIVELVDEGMKPADVAQVVGVSPQRIQAIVARVYAQD